MTISERNARIRLETRPLPGSVAYENRKPLNVPRKFAGHRLLELLRNLSPVTEDREWAELVALGRFELRGNVISLDTILNDGDPIIRITPETVEPSVNGEINVLFEDESLVVVNKPAPIPMHPCGRFNKNTMSAILGRAFAPIVLRLVHRLDANTSGVTLYAKTREAARSMQTQFEESLVRKVYLARIQGRPDFQTFENAAPIGRETLRTGGRTTVVDGLPALTRFRVVDHRGTSDSLVMAFPETGRTNQIRIHLWDLGFPILGDPLYLAERQLGSKQTLAPTEPPLCLHASELVLKHPETGENTVFRAPAPDWLVE